MALEFRFQTLLDFRQRTVEDLQLELARAQQRVASLRSEHDRLFQERARLFRHLQDRMRGPLDIAAVTHHYRYLESLDRLLFEKEQGIVDAEAAVETARRRLADARKEEKTLEKLRDYQIEQYREELLRQERNTLDDLNIARYVRNG